MPPTVRTALLAAALGAAALSSAGCVSTQAAEEPQKAPKAERVEGEGPSTGSRVAGYALAVPENVLWVPWKMVGGAVKGASDGVMAGFDKGRMPLAGVVFSPLNLVTGFVTGFVEGLTMPPMLVGPDDSYSKVMASPTKRTTTIWWYP